MRRLLIVLSLLCSVVAGCASPGMMGATPTAMDTPAVLGGHAD